MCSVLDFHDERTQVLGVAYAHGEPWGAVLVDVHSLGIVSPWPWLLGGVWGIELQWSDKLKGRLGEAIFKCMLLQWNQLQLPSPNNKINFLSQFSKRYHHKANDNVSM